MSRELDIEIARLDGCKPGRPDGEWECGCQDSRHDCEETSRLARYSEDLNALMELIERRWPEAAVFLQIHRAEIGVPLPGRLENRWFIGRGDTKEERLAHAVKLALEAEA